MKMRLWLLSILMFYNSAIDNGLQTDLSSFKANNKKAFNGPALAVVQSKNKAGDFILSANAEGLHSSTIVIHAK